MSVSEKHPQYAAYAPLWRRTDDACDGGPTLEKRKADYLIQPFSEDEPERFQVFCDGAYYVNFSGRTEATLSGMVFRKPPSYSLPSELEYLIENMDGGGESLEQVAKRGLKEVLRKRRFLILVDAGQAPDNATKEEKDALDVLPFCATYRAEDLINWHFETVNGKRKLALAVLRESVNIATDEFGHDYEDQYRVLRLRPDGYTQQLYRANEQPATEEIYITTRKGRKLDYIPLHGVRPLETSPLLPLVNINLAHYRNTASIEDLAALVSGANLHLDIGQTDMGEYKALNPGTFKLGGRTGTLTKGGKLEIVQADDRQLSRAVRDDKVSEMVAIGAAIIQRQGQSETAEAARIAASSQTSQLDLLVNDLSEDMEAAFESCAELLDIDPNSVEFKLSQDFWEASLDAQTLQAIIQGRTTGLYGDKTALHMIRKGKIELPEGVTDEEIQDDAANSFANIGPDPVI